MERTTGQLINRELSWLDFNDRVLSLAEDRSAPLLERVKFLAIFASNLDEFYMVRVAGLKRQVEAGFTERSPDGSTSEEQLAQIAERSKRSVDRHARLFLEEVLPALSEAEVHVMRWDQLDEVQCKELADFFHDQVFPVVTPLAVDPAHPFPYISHLSLNLAVLVRDPTTRARHFARVKVPPLLPRFVPLTTDGIFVPLEDVIAAHLDRLFPGMDVVEHHAFRVTRDADLEVDDDGAEDLLAAIEAELGRKRVSPAVRLEIESTMPPKVLTLLMRELQVNDEDVHDLPGPLGLGGLWDLYGFDRPELKDEKFQPVPHPSLAGPEDLPVDIFSVLQEEDILVHHPYHSFATTVEAFIEQAATDPHVLAIKQTLYRTSGGSRIVGALAGAAQAGKQVVVLVELRARFDERANIGWARTLERAGCHVVYGVVGLKTHCKLCLVVRQERDGLHRYVHTGTGNYNARTARLYEDLGLLTSDDRLGADVGDLFNALTGYSRQTGYRRLVIAPHGMRPKLDALIQREIELAAGGLGGRVIIKVNNIVDDQIVRALYDASQLGVQIDLIVRGICSLLPGKEGLSENIRVRSILGRFLEHSRIFYFRNAGEEEFYFGSADLMQRNLNRRVESLVRVDAHPLKEELGEMLALLLRDDVRAWHLRSDGGWMRDDSAHVDVQEEMMRRAVDRA